MLILNDVHIGVQRKAGTTPKSQEALRSYLFRSFEEILVGPGRDHDLMIVGDLFDQFEVAPRDWLQTFMVLQDWLVQTGKHLYLVAGNHDHSPKALRVSSFEMLCQVLKEQFGDRVLVLGIDQWDGNPQWMALAHCSNQDIFDQKLAEVLDAAHPGSFVFLHANYDNNFAAQSDHSLNVSEDVARAFAAKGVTLVFAHEHQARWAQFVTHDLQKLPGSVIVLGNQWPTSISDCLNNDQKFAYVFDGTKLNATVTWDRHSTSGFTEIDWRGLDTETDLPGFIRVSGDATGNEAGEVINAIARFRQKSDAFVISNAVRIDGIVKAEELPESFEVAKRFDVMAYIDKHLEPVEAAAVRELLGEPVKKEAFIED